jgi:protoporphyrinogen oxidase
VKQTLILGGGVTGLAAGLASGFPVYEATGQPGGICSSYWVCPGNAERIHERPEDGRGYRFEIGGGHWIFGGDPAVLAFLNSFGELRSYVRRSAVYFPERHQVVPYPLQNHLHHLGPRIAGRALAEMVIPSGVAMTMRDWLAHHFGHTLCDEFFFPFHDLYTAGLYDRIAPQDAFKSPIDVEAVKRGARGEGDDKVGYNAQFVYPADSLGGLANAMATGCEMHFDATVVRIDLQSRVVHFADGSTEPYDRLISTLPLTRMMEFTSLSVDSPADPFTSVLVLNIGAKRGRSCPDQQWLYVPSSRAGFHRVGFYSAVEPDFLPTPDGSRAEKVSIYVERAYPGGARPSSGDLHSFRRAAVEELQDWDFIAEAEVVDATWIDVAYTWSWPRSAWREKALSALEAHDIFPVGRYGRWVFQGIADSIRDGLMAGAALKHGKSGQRP